MPEPGSCGRCVASQASRSAWRGQVDDLQPQRLAPERAAVGPQRAVRARAELLGDVGDHAVVGRRGGAQHGDALGQPREHVARCAGSPGRKSWPQSLMQCASSTTSSPTRSANSGSIVVAEAAGC